MNKKIFCFILGILLTLAGFCIFYHPIINSNYDFLPQMSSNSENGIEVIETKEMAFKIAKQVWIEKYGFFSISCMVFDCRLEDNRYWILEGRNIFHNIFKICGGGPYIVIEKNGKIISLGYTG
ncbi:NTF2 fold immunity protein [Treponema sp.]|uniref:NTF2 fold immunity protein n=1 Tax=Treponema sp. TaxID=166 RepID=UPI00298DAC7B|nr:NTF2 fold immunity protein [Treponema sp.]MCR5612611.1 YbbC/YhhH family protein [Treponema sp.]